MCEVERPLSINLKGGYHTSCPYGYVGRGRVRVVTHGLNLPRHGTETARRVCGFYPVRGAGQSRPSRASGSNDRPHIKRTVQPRNSRLDRYSWESPIAGKTRQSRDTRRSSIHLEKAGACREAKGMNTCGGPGVWPPACGDR
jgi:hypothetical protein